MGHRRLNQTRDYAQVIRRRLASDQDLAEAIEREAFNANIAMQIYDARTKAGLTQKQVADRANTHQSVIARLEDADYDGHSLSMLRRIGQALNCVVRVELYDRTCSATVPYDPGVSFSSEISWPVADEASEAQFTVESQETNVTASVA